MPPIIFKAIYWMLHRIKSLRLHGIHSPFVFQLHQNILNDTSNFYAFEEIESIRAKLLLSDKVIEVKDLGAGSQFNKSNKRSISSIAKHASKKPKEAQLLFRLVQEYQPKTILELGTSLGISTAYMAKAASSAKIISMEGCPQTSKVAELNLKKLNIQNVSVINGPFDEHLKETLSQLKSVDFLFIDGNHTKEATLSYFNLCLPFLNEQSIIVFDDIYWSKGMLEAWKNICAHKSISVSIDLFEMGIVFFKKDQAKEHFTIYH